ncbi:MAG TPA: TolC family protein [Bacteroidales bacterium]|jgi:outer membrane protein|nr:TolC family protein [Bacteroidales bacterium]NLH32900.1 TolC family protein [Lentimicrobium sp.]OQC38533.1 MAG: outer membrane channel protein [Bacteroidetes bacterium ADurb.Bin041]HNV49569.1 TolC family protein [Bacteroidales bacterium]HPW42800.1 TolC family protein [Bacteroidales bacterium]
MKFKYLVIIVVLLFQASLSYSQESLRLSLMDARAYALEYNKTMKNSNFAIDKAQYALREAISAGLPQINASADYSNALGAKISIRFQEGMPAAEIDIKPQSNLYLNVNQLLFSGNYIVGVQLAKLSKEFSNLGLEKTELDVITAVSDAYYAVLITEEMLSILEKNVENLQDLYRKSEPMVHVGVIEQTDLDQLSVQLTSLLNVRSASERQAELAKNLLRLQLGASIDTELILLDTLEQLIEDSALENVLLNEFNPEGNIDFRMIQQQETLTRKMVDMNKANALPTLVAFYRYTHKLLKPDFDMSPPNMIGLQLNIPIFSSGQRYSQTQQAKVDLKTVENNKALVEDQLRITERQMRFNFQNALETFENQQKNIEVSRRVYLNLKLKYGQGMLSSLDLINADNNYLKAESDYINSMMQVLSTRLQLEKIYGTIY